MHRTSGRAVARIFMLTVLGLAACGALNPLLAQPAPAPRTLSVSGEAQIKAVPDEAQLSAGVVSQAPTARAALEANRRAMNAVFATLKSRGIPDKSIQTSEFSVSPQYNSGKDGTGPQRLVGYEVSNSVTVTIDDLSKVGDAIDALVSSGANAMGGVSFAISDPKPLLKEARTAAVQDALDRAATLAKASGVTLGPIIAINDGEASTSRPEFRAMTVAQAGMSTPIAAGEERVSASVSITFEIR